MNQDNEARWREEFSNWLYGDGFSSHPLYFLDESNLKPPREYPIYVECRMRASYLEAKRSSQQENTAQIQDLEKKYKVLKEALELISDRPIVGYVKLAREVLEQVKTMEGEG